MSPQSSGLCSERRELMGMGSVGKKNSVLPGTLLYCIGHYCRDHVTPYHYKRVETIFDFHMNALEHCKDCQRCQNGNLSYKEVSELLFSAFTDFGAKFYYVVVMSCYFQPDPNQIKSAFKHKVPRPLLLFRQEVGNGTNERKSTFGKIGWGVFGGILMEWCCLHWSQKRGGGRQSTTSLDEIGDLFILLSFVLELYYFVNIILIIL